MIAVYETPFDLPRGSKSGEQHRFIKF